MIFYRLVVCRLMKFLGLDEIYKERERRAIMMGKKKKPIHKPKLLMNENMKTCTFLILAIINMLFMLTLPVMILKEPCEVFKKYNMPNFYAFTVTVKNYANWIDTVNIFLFVALVIVGVKTVLDAIAVTKIDMSPWLEQGKYALPGTSCCDHKTKDPAKERAKARARARYYDQISEKIYKLYEESNGRCFEPNYQEYYGRYNKLINQQYNQSFEEIYDQMRDQTLDKDIKKTDDQSSDESNDETYDSAFE